MHRILFSILLSATAVSIYAEGNHKGGHSHKAGVHWAAPKDAAARVNPIKSDLTSIERGANSYKLFCVSCHGVEAMGDGPAAAALDPKPTNLKAMSGGHEDGDFAWKIANGRGAMPPWKEILDENQIWDLVNFIQNLKDEDHHDNAADEHSHGGDHKHSGSHTQ